MRRRLAALSRLPRRDRLQVGIILNQLATPGLGSWITGRRLAGLAQITIACAGFGIFLVFFGRVLRVSWIALVSGIDEPMPDDSLWHRALLVFGVAWLWAGVTSLQMALELRRLPRIPTPPPLTPPPRLLP